MSLFRGWDAHTIDDMAESAPTPYEIEQLAAIQRWQAVPPGWGTRLLSKPSGKVAQVVQSLVPVEVLRGALRHVNRVAERLADERSVLKRARLASIDELRAAPLEVCDRLMRAEQRWALGLAGAGGAAFGVAGAAGMIVDVPALITLALRTIHRVGICYGDDPLADERGRLAIAVFALASANSMDEKSTAITAIRDFSSGLLDEALRDGVERVAERELAKEAAVFSMNNLARKLGLHLGARKSAGVLPVLGAVVGASVNSWYAYDIAQVSRYVFQERWLRRRYPGMDFDDPESPLLNALR